MVMSVYVCVSTLLIPGMAFTLSRNSASGAKPLCSQSPKVAAESATMTYDFFERALQSEDKRKLNDVIF
jgi:hypothetical protein